MPPSFPDRRSVVGPLLLLVTLLTSSCVPDRPARLRGGPEEGVSLELARHRAGTLSDLRYDYRLRIPASSDEPVDGVLDLRLRRVDPTGAPLVLDFVQSRERVRWVRVNGVPAEPEHRADHLVLGAALLRDGENRIEIAFRAGDASLNRSGDFLYTLFVPDRAHHALPILDQPDLKGRFRLELDVPGSWVAVSNTPVEDERDLASRTAAGPTGAGDPGTADREPPEGRRRVRFARTPPLPSYLFAFAAGEFLVEETEADGRPMRMYHRETDRAAVERNRDDAFDLHAASLRWLEEYTGIAHPFERFDFVLIPGFQYGGMEHPGQILYRQSGILLEPTATQSDFLARASVIAHETAHMWFGDLVTMRWFDDVWMKEVFANFIADKVVAPAFPEVRHDLRFLLAHQPRAYAVDRTPGTNPVRQPLDNLREAGTLYGPIIYQKAPVVMRQLEALIGEGAFREGVREYLAEHRFGNASWTDLIRILDRRTDEDLEAWSRVWVEEPGRPRIEAHVVPDGAGDRIASLLLVQDDPAGRGRLWPQRLEVVIGYGDTLHRVPVRLTGPAERLEGWEGRPLPDFVLPDGSGEGYGHFHLDPRTVGYLLDSLPSLPDPLVRGSGHVSLHDELWEGEVPVGRYLDLLLRSLGREDDEQILQRTLSDLRTVWWRFLERDERLRGAPRVEEVLLEGIAEAPSATVRSAFFRTWRDVALSPGAVARMRRIRAGEEEVGGLELSVRDRTALAEQLALHGVSDAEEILDRQEAAIDNPDRLERFRFVRPALSGDPATRADFFRSLREPERREREPWVLDALRFLHHPLRAEGSVDLVRPALELLPEIQRTGDIFFPERWAAAVLGGHASPEAAEVVEEYLDGPGRDLPPRLRGKLLQAYDPLRRAAAIREGR